MKLFRQNMAKIRGFSLVELMVAITIGLIILAAVSAVFVSSKRSYSTQDRLARLQENARFAMQFMTRDIRMAGYSGCVKDLPNINNVSGIGGMNIALEGIDNTGSTSTWLPSAAAKPADIKDETDAIAIRAADPSQITALTSAMESESDFLPVASTAGLNDNNIILVADCSNADVLQITAVNSPLLEHAVNLGKLYDTSAQVMKFYTRIYYVKNRADGTPALFLDENGSEQELVEGVEDLQILYGVDTDADGAPNVYKNASDVGAAWPSVKSVRIGMLVRTPNDKDLDPDIQPSYDVNGNIFTVPTDAGGNRDRYQRRVFQTTIQVRNL